MSGGRTTGFSPACPGGLPTRVPRSPSGSSWEADAAAEDGADEASWPQSHGDDAYRAAPEDTEAGPAATSWRTGAGAQWQPGEAPAQWPAAGEAAPWQAAGAARPRRASVPASAAAAGPREAARPARRWTPDAEAGAEPGEDGEPFEWRPARPSALLPPADENES